MDNGKKKKRRDIITIRLLVLLFGGFVPGGWAQTAAPRYAVMSLGMLGGKTSTAMAINASGQVVGLAETADGKKHAFLFSGGKMRDLGTLGGPTSTAWALNASGQVVGESDAESVIHTPVSHAFLYDHGKMQDLGTLGGEDSVANGINASGVIVGGADVDRRLVNLDHPGGRHAFQYSNGQMQDLGGLAGNATGVNDAGEIALGVLLKADPGNGILTILRAAVIEKGEMRELGLPVMQISIAKAINASGQVTGIGTLRDPATGKITQKHAFLYTQGSSQDLGTLGGENSRALGLNDSGWVVGNSDSTSDGVHAFLFKGDRMLDLNMLVDHDALAAAGFKVLTTAMGINDGGQIVGIGMDAGENEMAFFLSPKN